MNLLSPHIKRALIPLAIALPLLIPPAIQAQYRITGTILNATEGVPIPHAHISAEPDRPCLKPEASPSSTSDDQGHFTLAIPCANIWRITAEALNFASQRFEQHGLYSTGIVLTLAEPTYDVPFRLTPDSDISGLILDEAGEPIRDAKVSLLRFEAGPDQSHPAASTATDDLGSYEFSNLLPGDYQIAVQAQPWYAAAGRGGIRVNSLPAAQVAATTADPSLDLTYPITYYPGATSRDAAGIIQLAGGANQQADIRLTPIPSIHVLLPPGAASDQGLDTRRPITVPQMERLSDLGSSDFRPTSVTIAPDGSIDLGGFAPGTYGLSRFRSRGEQQTFELAPDSPRTVEPKFATRATEDDDTPHTHSRRELQERNSDGDQNRSGAPGITLTGIPVLPGKHTGPAAGTLLLLIPVTPTHNPPSSPRQQSNTDGSFNFTHITPGRYILLAIQNGWNLDLRTPATLNNYLVKGLPLNLTSSTTLHQAIPAQTP